MKTILIVSAAVILIFSLSNCLIAQSVEIDFENLPIGKNYRVIMTSGWEAEGMLEKVDSNLIQIKSEYRIFSIPKTQIKDIIRVASESEIEEKVRESNKSKFSNDKIYLSLGSGVSFKPVWGSQRHKEGINLQFNVMKIMSPSHAIRGDIQFANNPTLNYRYEYGGTEGGSLNSYSIKINFLLGDFKPKTDVNGYAILGGGLNILKETDTKHFFREYNYKTMEYTGNIINYVEQNEAQKYFNLDLGGGLRIKVTDKIKIYGEGQYTFPFVSISGRGGGPSLYGIFFGIPSVRIGAQLEL